MSAQVWDQVMRLVIIALALLSLAAGPAPKPGAAATPVAMPAASGDWQVFRDPAGAFSAEFPQTPSTQKQTSGAVATTVYAVNIGTSALMVIVSDMSSLSLDAKRATESAIASLLQAKTPIGNKAIKLGRHAGRVVTASDTNTLYTDQIYFFNHHLYQAISARPNAPTAEEAARAEHFNKSFRLK